jgi:hypothetical protein
LAFEDACETASRLDPQGKANSIAAAIEFSFSRSGSFNKPVNARATRSEEGSAHAGIEKVYQGYVQAGKALRVIRDGRLYREAYPTFAEFCQKEFEQNVRYINRKIEAAALSREFVEAGLMPPDSERVARELIALPKDVRTLVWHKVTEKAKQGAGGITSKSVKDEAAKWTEIRL